MGESLWSRFIEVATKRGNLLHTSRIVQNLGEEVLRLLVVAIYISPRKDNLIILNFFFLAKRKAPVGIYRFILITERKSVIIILLSRFKYKIFTR
jgi:hypothetical protein